MITLMVVLVSTILVFFTAWGSIPGHALPEYANRTGGPRTLRGLLWAARGKADQVPDLPNLLVAPGVNNGDELYEIGCSACHGKNGEGLFGVVLVNSGLPENKIRSQILNGRARSGMPSFQGKFTKDQLDALVKYVAGIASGEIPPAPNSYPLETGHLTCKPTAANSSCGGN